MKYFLSLILVFAVKLSVGQWNNSPLVNNVVTNVTGFQGGHSITTDNRGGAIVAWYQNEVNGTDNSIYVQRIDADGNLKWGNQGLLVCSTNGYRYFPQLYPDGNGGAVVGWTDLRNGKTDVYAQKVDSSGQIKWTQNGVAVCVAANDKYHLDVVSSEPGAYVFTWTDNRSGTTSDIYAQKLDDYGNALWTNDGIVVCNAIRYQSSPKVCRDENGGVIISWIDSRSTDYNVYAQRINSAGALLWSTNGVAVSTAGSQGNTEIVSDYNGGAFIAWYDYRSGASDIYAAHLNASGINTWVSNGTPVCRAANYQEFQKIINDQHGGIYITFMDLRNSLQYENRDIYAQRLDSLGNSLWATNGIPVCTNSSDQRYPMLVPDNNDGILVTWMDTRNGAQDIYAQAINSDGTTRFQTNGIAVCTAANDQDYPKLVSNNLDGAIVAWEDKRNDGANDLYASKLLNGISKFCAGAGATVCSNIDAATYQWQMSVDDGASFSNITDGINYQGATTDSLTLINVPSSWYGYHFRCLSGTDTSIAFKVKIQSTWLGTVDNSWEKPANWSCGLKPDINTDVEIKKGSPVIGENESCRSIQIKNGSSVTINANLSLTLAGKK